MRKRGLIGFITSSVIIIGLLFGILVSSAHGVAAQSTSGSPTPTTTPFLTEIPVLLAQLSTSGTDPTATIRTALSQMTGYRMTLKTAGQAFKTSDEARAFALKSPTKYIAVIWADSGVVHYEMMRRLELESYDPISREQSTGRGVIALPDEMELKIDATLLADTKTLAAYTQTQVYLAAADYPNAFRTLNNAETAFTANSALAQNTLQDEITFEDAFLNAIQGNASNALQAFDTLSQGQPRAALQAYASSNVGGLLIAQGDFNNAATALDKALTIDNSLSWALLNRGSLNFEQNNNTDALNDYNTILQNDPQNEFALNDRGWLQYLAGNPDLAFTDLNAAVKADPRFVDAWLNLAAVLRSGNQLNSAISAANRAIQLDTQYSAAYAVRGNLFTRLGDYPDALADFNHAILLDPRDAVSLDNRGGVYEQLGDDDKAFADYTRAIESSPQDIFAYLDRGHIYLKRGDFTAAVLDESLAIQFDTAHRVTSSYYYRAEAYQGLQRWDDALRDYKKYIAVAPQGFYAKAAQAYIRAVSDLLTSTPTPSFTPTDTPQPTATLLPTHTPAPTDTLVPSDTPTAVPSHTPLPTRTPRPRPTVRPSATSVPTDIPSATPLPTEIIIVTAAATAGF